MSGSVVVNISAAKFASLLSANNTPSNSKIAVSDLTNLVVAGDSSNSTPLGRAGITKSDIEDPYDGTNRLFQGESYFWDNTSPIEISVLQALRLDDLNGSKEFKAKVTLSDSAENLSVALKAFSDAQFESFS